MTTLRLSEDLFPHPRFRHWLQARGSSVIAWGLAEAEARMRRHRCLALSSHGTDSRDLGDARCGLGRVRREPELKLVKARRTA